MPHTPSWHFRAGIRVGMGAGVLERKVRERGNETTQKCNTICSGTMCDLSLLGKENRTGNQVIHIPDVGLELITLGSRAVCSRTGNQETPIPAIAPTPPRCVTSLANSAFVFPPVKWEKVFFLSTIRMQINISAAFLSHCTECLKDQTLNSDFLGTSPNSTF